MNQEQTVVFFDVDNTLLDNDRVTRDIANKLATVCGPEACRRYWELFEKIRVEKGYADYLAALQEYRAEDLQDPKLLHLSLFLTDYPFANRLFPGSLDAIESAARIGMPAILTDGDVVFQPRKIYRSGLLEAVNNRVIICVHKERELAAVERLMPAGHYVMVDDKLRILAAMKEVWGTRLTTVFVRQGHYALESGIEARYPPADFRIDHIGEFPALSAGQNFGAGR